MASFPNNGRYLLIAGGISFIGFLLNIVIFLNLIGRK